MLIAWLYLVVWFVYIECQDYQDRPKISSLNGHLILEAAQDKNIYLRVNGPKSGIFAKDINLLHLGISDIGEHYQIAASDNFEKYLNGPNGILSRLDRLEKQVTATPSDLLLNITLMMRRINRLTNRVSNLQFQLNSRGRDQCQSSPCQNAGTCLNLASGYHCLCPSNWEGRNCEVDVNECRNFAGTDLGCQNRATCINRPGTYECLCAAGWFGIHCTRREKDCSAGNFEMCGYGTCVPVASGEGIKCLCNQGWETNGTGVACLTDVNECDSSHGSRCSANPKVNCINLPGSFRCGQCPAGYEGDGFTCHDIDECVTTPNGGCSPLTTCHNTIGSRICGPCPPGYQGDGATCTWRGSCNVNHGGCHPSAQCLETMAIVQCICPLGMEGDGVGLHGCYVAVGGNSTQHCETNPCGVHGQCHLLLSGYTCLCFKGYSGVHCDIPIDYCSGNPCQNGGTCKPDDSSTGFRCECTAQYSGHLCQMRAKSCSGVLDAEEGSLIYPLTNNSYDHNSKCAWVIHTAPNKVINVTFSKFNLELEPECMYDFLQIHDGRTSSSQLIGRFCGNELPKGGNIISSTNNLYLWFRSDKTVAKDGFALHWNSINPVCGGEVDATTYGHINSPGSPGKYPPNRDCYWHLTTSFGKRILLHFFALDIETHSNCSFDYLVIYDGEQASDLLAKYCNSTQPPPVQSSSSELSIHFHSDAYGSGNGFQITFAPVEGIPGCGGLYTLDRGEIVSPSYNDVYLSNLLCEYKINTGPDTKIRINFKSFKLESSIRCRYDYLKVYDGPSANSKLVGKFCGVTYPKSYISSSNNLFIIFKTDHSTASDGFKITFETVCQKTIFGNSGIVKSPGYPFSYPNNKVCEYIIGTVPGKAIQLTFQDFDIEDNRYYNCQYDNVEIRDGSDRNATLLGRFCGGSEHIPPVQTSTHNYLYLRFNSDMSISGTGFYANYTTIDTECGGIFRETTGLVSYPSGDNTATYKSNQKCTWMLIAPEGMHVKLTWNRFDIENMPSCSSDYLELIEIDGSNNNETLGKFCGSSPPPALTTTTNRLMLRFQSDSSVKLTGFSLSYTFLDVRTHCGAVYVKSHGFIYSPGWPKRYEPNRDCTWTITVPVGQQIMLNISQFDLERPIRDKCDLGDFLEIRNGATKNSPLIGKYCGSFQSRRIISIANKLFLRFHSDFYMTGNGFKIEWDGTITGCGGTLTSSSGSISSPNYPENYYENAECFYKIVTSQGSRIRIRFSDLDLERTASCRDDYVEIFDGRDENSNSLGKHCFMEPNLNSIETSSNTAFIKFRTDIYIVSRGFLINYDTVCQNNITGRYGVIESPDYPSNYRLNLNCLWTINVPKGNKINVTFTHFDIYKSYRPAFRNYGSFRWPLHDHTSTQLRSNCENDYLQWKETDQPQFSKKYCGLDSPRIQSTDNNSLQIKFVTGTFIPRTGFRLEWISYGCGGYIQKRFGSIILDKSIASSREMECEWLIESPLGTSITITFASAYMTDSPNCTIDAIEIFNGQTVNSPLITKFCHRSSTYVQSSTNFMLIRFSKRSNLRNVFFTSNFHSWKSGCGARIVAMSGVIYSQNYPKNYDNNLDCLWTLAVPINHRIELNFMDLDLYSDIDDEGSLCGDNIKLYDSSRITNLNYSQLICPETKSKQYISKNNNLALQFMTDGYGTAKGFKANFTITCGAIINASRDGILTNDNFFRYTNRSCIWTIHAPTPDQKITLTITHLSLPKNYDILTNRSCPSSFLRIREGDDVSAPLIGEYCGRKIPPSIVSHGYALTLELGTYTNSIEGQFSAHYTSFTSACGGTLTSEEGDIASPNYPQPYPINTDCEWTLGTSPGNKVYIVFETFNLQYSEGCNQDYLEVRESHSGGPLLGLYCGDDIPTNTTTASKLYIRFHTDSKDSRTGFLINYGFIHGNDIMGLESGIVTSPLYPSSYVGAADYSWRITVPKDTITLFISKLEIMSQGESCSNFLAIYDGYDEDASLIENLCGIFNNNEKVVHTTSNVAYLKLKLHETNTGSLFSIRWSRTDNAESQIASEYTINCGSNETQILSAGDSATIQTPNYPENYGNNLKCQWIYKSTPGRHLTLKFLAIKLEQTSGCFADSVSIFTSDTPTQWVPIKEKVCLSEDFAKTMNASSYIKIAFETDSTVTAKGFEAKVFSACGGTLTDVSGIVTPSWWDFKQRNYFIGNCVWKIKVRPGRLIKLQFLQFNITSVDCSTFVTLRNGDSIESPLLSSGKYCGYSHEERNEIITSSNLLFVSYTSTYSNTLTTNIFKSFKLWYEEKTVECGATVMLNSDHNWEEITSPNYPSIPTPYTECIWKFSGPPGEILRIDFNRIDIDKDTDCNLEFIDVRDGSSELSPLKGRLCGTEIPGTIKTSNNVLYVKYSTQKQTPNNGFKANVSLDVCGGTINARTGALSSPGYPHMPILKYGTVCEWRVIGNSLFTFLFQAQDINLPDSEAPCDTKVTIEESFPENNTVTILKTFCSDAVFQDSPHELIETLSNDVTIKLRIGKPSEYTQVSEHRGFRFTFNSSIPKCGGMINTPEGYLSTPGYPRDTTIRSCHWKITVPESRRVTLEFLDADVQRHRINIYNDKSYRSLLQTIPSDDYSPSTQIFESSGNTLAIYIWLGPSTGARHRFKAKFSSDKPALCGDRLRGSSGHFMSPILDRAYTCIWNYNYDARDIISTSSNTTNIPVNTLYVKVYINSTISINNELCRYSDPKLNINSIISNRGIRFNRDFCHSTDTAIRIPSSTVDFMAVKSKSASLSFDVQWKLQLCGGVVHATENSVNILNVPSSYNDSLDCAWILVVPIGRRIEVKIDGSFQLNCNDEFITINPDITATSTTIGDYCKDRALESPTLLKYSTLYVQYHSKRKTETRIKLMVKTVQNECGGYLMTYESVFESPNYPKNYIENQECTWEIKTDIGSRISLQFIGRFAIEARPNCTKDVIIIYDWKDNAYFEVARLCGRVPPPPYNSTFNKMKVVLRTDYEINLDGFQARWVRICGGNYTATAKEQFLYSPGYPFGYTHNLKCDYIISGGGGRVVVKFVDFEIEGPFPDCNNDNLTIAGQSTNDYLYNEIYCGTETPPILSYDQVTLILQTDTYKSKKGFKLSYATVSCGGEINEPTVITSNPTNYYSNNLNCSWLIKAPRNKTVVLRFLYFDLESSTGCYNDFIAIYNGLSVNNDNRLSLMCGRGDNTSTIIKSSENTMLLYLRTDNSVGGKGFRVAVSFTYSTAVGCGGFINLTSTSTYNLKSPLIGSKLVYENFLDCHWTIVAPVDHVIKIKFTSFHIAPCQDINQTAVGYNKCDCDFVEIRDGITPDSPVMDSYCGHTIPPELVTSDKGLILRLFTDGEINSSGFEVTLSTRGSVCGQSTYTVSKNPQYLTSPGYNTGSIPRGIHCVYHIEANQQYSQIVHLRIKTMDIQPAVHSNLCNRDMLVVSKLTKPRNTTLGKDFVLNMDNDLYFDSAYLFEQSDLLSYPTSFIYCGIMSSIDLYFISSVTVTAVISAESDAINHKGFQLEFMLGSYCGRNYTDRYGRVRSVEQYYEYETKHDCYTLITAPENQTVSAYFLRTAPTYWIEESYLEIHDGDKTSDRSLKKIGIEFSDTLAVFSTGRNMLLHNHVHNDGYINYDLTYVTTDKGPGCGGKLYNVVGRITSPMYPDVYRRKVTCEWELETPTASRLLLRFSVFDLGRACDQVYVQLVDRKGNIISTYCSATPADHTSDDNYVKVVFTTTMNNGGTGWVAEFAGIKLTTSG